MRVYQDERKNKQPGYEIISLEVYVMKEEFLTHEVSRFNKT